MIYIIGIALFVIWIVLSIVKANKAYGSMSQTMKYIIAVCFATNCACDCGALSFGGGSKSDKGNMQQRLKQNWDVKSKEDLLNTVQWLINEGHHAESQAFFELYRTNPDQIKSKGPLRRGEREKVLEKIEAVVREKESAGIIAWDLCRAANIMSWGYIAGYVSFEEAFVQCVKICKQIQSTFDSWEQMMNSYLVGHFYWSQSFFETCKRMSYIEDEVYQIPWNTNLDENDMK